MPKKNSAINLDDPTAAPTTAPTTSLSSIQNQSLVKTEKKNEIISLTSDEEEIRRILERRPINPPINGHYKT